MEAEGRPPWFTEEMWEEWLSEFSVSFSVSGADRLVTIAQARELEAWFKVTSTR